MTDIYPAQDQLISVVIGELEKLDLAFGTDFRLEYSWDAKPFLKATPEAYETWANAHGGGIDSAVEKSDEEPVKGSSSGSGKDESGAQSGRPAKRR